MDLRFADSHGREVEKPPKPTKQALMLRSAVGVALATGVTVAVFTYRQRRALTSAAKRALRAHYCRDVDDELLHVLRTSATEAVSVTAGGDLPDDVDVLIFPGAATPDRVYAAAAALPNLKALIMAYAGILPAQIDKMRVAFGDRLGSTVTLHNLHHNAPMTAEMGVALLLAATKRLLPADAKLRAGDWRPRGLPFPGEEVDPPMPMVLLEGRTALVLGLGHLGTRVAKVLHALGMRVLGTRRSVRPGSMTVVDGVEVCIQCRGAPFAAACMCSRRRHLHHRCTVPKSSLHCCHVLTCS